MWSFLLFAFGPMKQYCRATWYLLQRWPMLPFLSFYMSADKCSSCSPFFMYYVFHDAVNEPCIFQFKRCWDCSGRQWNSHEDEKQFAQTVLSNCAVYFKNSETRAITVTRSRICIRTGSLIYQSQFRDVSSYRFYSTRCFYWWFNQVYAICFFLFSSFLCYVCKSKAPHLGVR